MGDKLAKEKGLKIAKLSGTEFRKRLRSGDEIPEWFAFPSVVKTLRDGGDAIFLLARMRQGLVFKLFYFPFDRRDGTICPRHEVFVFCDIFLRRDMFACIDLGRRRCLSASCILM